MKTSMTLIFLLLGSLTTLAANSTKHSSKSSPKNKSTSSLSTDVKFADQAVSGKYQLPMEALSVVENEKSIDDLIGVRKNFQDRVARTKGMR